MWASLLTRLILGPANALAQWVVSNILKLAWGYVVSAYEKYIDDTRVKEIKKAEEKLKEAKTEKEVDDALDSIRRNR